MTDSHVVPTVAVALVTVLALATFTGPAAASEHLSLSCADGDDGAVFVTDEGLEVSDDTGGGVTVNPFVDDSTLGFGNVTVRAGGSAGTVLEAATAGRVCLGETNATAASLDLDAENGTSVTVDGDLSALTYGAVSYDAGGTDLRYDAADALTLTVGGAPADATVRAVAGDGTALATATATGGSVALALPAGTHAVDLQAETPPAGLDVALEPESVTAGNATDVTVTATDAGTGEAVPNATATLSALNRTATTDASGEATLSITPSGPGSLQMAVGAEGYADANVTLAVQPENATRPADLRASSVSPDGVNVTAGDNITVTADVENVGDQRGVQTVEFRLNASGAPLNDGTTLASQSVSLNGSETTTVTFENVSTDGLDAGDYTHGVFSENDSATATITVEEAAPEPAPGQVAISNVDLTPNAADANTTNDHTLTFDVSNASDDGSGDTLTLTFPDGTLVNTSTSAVDADGDVVPVEVGSGIGTTTFNASTDASTGDYTVTVNATVSVPDVDNQTTAGIQVEWEDSSNGTASVTVTLSIEPADDGQNPEIVEGTPAADTDGDGLLDDLNGNDAVDRGDAQALFNALGTQVVDDNADVFDYNENGQVDRGDVQALFVAAQD